MARFSFSNPNQGSVYFVLETIRNSQGFYDSSSLNGGLGAYYNFTGSTSANLVSSNYAFGYVIPPGSSSFEYNPTEYIQTGSVYFRGTGNFTVSIVGEVTSSTYTAAQLNGTGSLNTIPLENVFEATWNTTRTTSGSTPSTQIALPLLTAVSGGLYNFVVNWGDNTSSSISSSLQIETTHSYAVAGTYTTKMWGTIRGWRFGGSRDRNKIQTVNKWGGLQFVSHPDKVMAAFSACQSASFSNVIGVPDLRYTDSLRSGFNACRNLTTINNLEKWDISRITTLARTFASAINFNQDIGSWDVSNVTDMTFTFGNIYPVLDGVTFIGNGKFANGGSPSINNWNTSRVTNMSGLFYNCPEFDQNIGSWNVGNVTDMSFMFSMPVTPDTTNSGLFNNGGSPSIGNWNTSRVTTMQQMFNNNVRFNQNIGSWDVSNVTNFTAMFGVYLSTSTPWQTLSGSFTNGGSSTIGNWNTSKATNMSFMFMNQLSFNQNIGSWDVSKVTSFNSMFALNNPTPTFTSSLFLFNNGGSPSINNWNTTSSTRIDQMFRQAGGFNQPIGNWRVSSVTNFANFMTDKSDADYSVTNYNALLNGWASRPVVSGRSINFGTIKYSVAASASRAILTSAPNSWTIVDGGQV
jgi:surface protein